MHALMSCLAPTWRKGASIDSAIAAATIADPAIAAIPARVIMKMSMNSNICILRFLVIWMDEDQD